MTLSTTTQLPDAQVQPLLRAYDQARAASRLTSLLWAAALIVVVGLASWIAEIHPLTFFEKIGGFTSYFERLTHLDDGAYVWTNPAEWFWGLKKWLRLLGETILIAYSGTFIGAVLAVVFSFMSAANLNGSPLLRGMVKRGLEFCRTVPDLVFALIFVVAFGVGALPGIIAIVIHTIGALGKLFGELVENIDSGPLEGLTASGAGKIALARFGVLPQVAPGFLSYALLRFEINVRGATVMGFVGAGGIGDELMITIRQFHYSDISAILCIIIATVFLIDMLTTRLRRYLLTGGMF
ncbi:MAG: phosphonate ABC transporter, permease protein PhnE [Alphaproteobacteria bacterium]|nr:phosphonate ABC transporter, permease protein PhnE [Alphaproteobacteria bacterium]